MNATAKGKAKDGLAFVGGLVGSVWRKKENNRNSHLDRAGHHKGKQWLSICCRARSWRYSLSPLYDVQWSAAAQRRYHQMSTGVCDDIERLNEGEGGKSPRIAMRETACPLSHQIFSQNGIIEPNFTRKKAMSYSLSLYPCFVKSFLDCFVPWRSNRRTSYSPKFLKGIILLKNFKVELIN